MNEAVEQLTIHELPLAEMHRECGASFAERDGWMLPIDYGDARAEYEAVRGAAGAGLIDLSARGRIEVRGAEAVQFLNGLITNDVKTLAPGVWMRAAFPNVQGRLLASVRVARPGEESAFLIDTEPATHRKVFQLLERFTLAGDFHVKDMSGETAQFSLRGQRAAAIIESVFDASSLQMGPKSVASFSWRESYRLVIAARAEEDGYDFICAVSGATQLWETLLKEGALPVGQDALEVLRVEDGEPRFGVDINETNVVLEAGQEDEAVSYTKGCYIGQEIIARIHWRGHVAKRLAGLVLEDERELEAGAKVRAADGREIGRITSNVFSPSLGRRIALAILKYDYLQAGTRVSVVAGEEERAAEVAELPFTRGSRHATDAHSEAEKVGNSGGANSGNGGNGDDVETTS